MRVASFFILLFGLMSCQSHSQNKDAEAVKDIQHFQLELNKEYADKETSPLTDEDLKNFKALDFFTIDLKYRVKARFVINQFPVPFEMSTTTDRKPMYQKYGTLYFEIDRVSCSLPVYQGIDLMQKEEYKNYLFVPFTDLTNGVETYGGGRYVDLEGPLTGEVILDFNKAYNPYCAYSHRYSCVIPPKENKLNVAIKAGVKKFH